jgi:transposase, IS5 family
MKTSKSKSFFDEDFRLEKLSEKKDPLEKLEKYIDWEIFRPILNKVFYKEPKGKGGRPPYDYVMMFKTLILQRYYNISDEQVEYQILDRLSFMRFLGLKIQDNVPDRNTVWLFRENLTNSGVIDEIFALFNEQLKRKGLIASQGSIIDASFVEVPRQRNSREENKTIKEDKVPDTFSENKNKLAQKDLDARWVTKGEEHFYGYKDHVKVCKKSKLIETYVVTDASVHDSQPLAYLIDETNANQELYADSAYSGDPIANYLEMESIKNRIHEKAKKNKPLTEEQIANNNIKTKTRVRVEHVFGFMENSMHGMYIRTIGMIRARAVIGLMNLTYNMFRSIQLVCA